MWRSVFSRIRAAQHGQVIVLSALSITMLLGFTGLAIDVGLMLHTRTDIQKDVDAMALAGAQALCGTAECEPQANADAFEWGDANGVQVSDTVVVQFGVDCDGGTSANYDLITVRVTRHQSAYFARVVGFTGSDIRACATARKSAIGSLSGVRPFALERECIDGIGYDDVVTLKFDSDGHGPCDAYLGNFGMLALDGTGQSVIRDSVKYGSTSVICSVQVPTCENYLFDTQPGNAVSVKQALQWVEQNTPPACDTWGEVVQGEGQEETINPPCNPWKSDYETRWGTKATRLWLIPIILNTEPIGGSHEIQIWKFAIVFWEGNSSDCKGGGGGPTSCEIKARFVESDVNLPGSDPIDYYRGATATKVALVK